MTTGGGCGQEGGTQEQLCSIVMKFTVKTNRMLVFGFYLCVCVCVCVCVDQEEIG